MLVYGQEKNTSCSGVELG